MRAAGGMKNRNFGAHSIRDAVVAFINKQVSIPKEAGNISLPDVSRWFNNFIDLQSARNQ
ncbi:hypothetical protein O9992_21055 [Vibrio lentus]|nr:hypothetical protein [Vibrio lentus]